MLLIAANACNNEANSCKRLQLPADACKMKYLQNEIPAESVKQLVKIQVATWNYTSSSNYFSRSFKNFKTAGSP